MKLSIPKIDIAFQLSPSAAVPPAEYPNGMRVADKVLTAFNHACLMGDLETAEELLVIMDKLAERRIRRFGGDRRRETFTSCAAREYLETLQAQRLR